MTHFASSHRHGRARAGAVALAVLLAVGVLPGPAAAKSQKKLAYAYEQVWPAAVRFLRVDEGCEILEKDMDAGYVIFTLSDDGKRFRGTLEIVRTGDEQPSLLLLVGLEDRPAYMEQGILDRFEQKLRAELGSPRPAKPTPAPAPAPRPKDDGEPARP